METNHLIGTEVRLNKRGVFRCSLHRTSIVSGVIEKIEHVGKSNYYTGEYSYQIRWNDQRYRLVIGRNWTEDFLKFINTIETDTMWFRMV